MIVELLPNNLVRSKCIEVKHMEYSAVADTLKTYLFFFFLEYNVIVQNYRTSYGYVQIKLLFVKDSAH